MHIPEEMKPIASISIDVDDKWTYIKTNGDENWKNYPTYLDWVVPRILDFLSKKEVKITFFLVGKDVERESNQSIFNSITQHGHEIGNHSYNHDQWMSTYSAKEIEEEIVKTHDLIKSLTGYNAVGYRGPGYSFSPTAFHVLSESGYVYDGSVWPSFIGPISHLFLKLTSNFTKLDDEKKAGLFGSWKDGFRPNKPFHLENGQHSLLEIPVTTMPFSRLPIHATYVMFLYRINKRLALWYFWLSVRICRLVGTSPSLLLHPPDFIGVDDNSELDFYPNMKLKKEVKLECLGAMIDILGRYYRLVTMGTQANEILSAKDSITKFRKKSYDVNKFFDNSQRSN